MQRKPALHFALLLFAAVALTLPLATGVFAAVPMRASRRVFGRGPFWTGHLLGVGIFALLGVWPAAAALGLLAALVGSYAEVEEHGSSVFSSACFAVLATLGAATIGIAAWIATTKGNVVAVMRTEIADVARRMIEYNPKMEINVDAIVYQTPSLLAVVLMLALAAGLAWENRALGWLRLPKAEGVRERLSEFRIPDVCIWMTMLAILGGFALRGRYPAVENVSLNALNVLVALYFFQGLAIVARTFKAFEVTFFWRGFWYVMIAVQLHFLVSALGFADYWLDFRTKLAKARPFKTNREA